MTTPRMLAMATFALTGALASADGPIGAPCFANESAIELFTNVDLAGKVSVVTGADTGIGLEVARALAARGATVVMPARNPSKMRLAAAGIKRTVPRAHLVLPESSLDLASFATVRALAEELQRFPAIDILVNNAGTDSNPHQLMTEDGLELTFQVDYPSHWLLTHLLLPQLRLAKGRVVNVASKAYALACELSMRWNCMALNRLPPPVISSTKAVPVLGSTRSNYGIAKQLMLRWTEELARRESVAGTGVTAFSLHPGFVNTSMAAAVTPFWHWFACKSDGREGAPCPTTPAQGALTPTFLALAPGIEGSSGSYYEWCAKTKPMVGPASQAFQDALWNLTLKWVSNVSAPLGVAGVDAVIV
mmetsp:Transcript_51748/g.147507  ORF Transcript_51748/g.147507 Transcript_51748/m.147507 type:complete len:362 (-) Transcript_51748:73-1158(-)